MEKDFFVGIKNPLDVRRNVLECSREMLKTLQTHEKLEMIREEKLKRIQVLKTIIKELEMLFSNLSTRLPKTHLRAGNPAPARPTKGPRSNKLENLEMEIKDLEEEIERLG